MKKLLMALAAICMALTLCACGSNAPQGLYYDSNEVWDHHPADDLTWSKDTITTGTDKVWEYKLSGDKLSLVERDNIGEEWVCKLNYVDGIKIIELDDYNADNNQFCPFYGRYFKQ